MNYTQRFFSQGFLLDDFFPPKTQIFGKFRQILRERVEFRQKIGSFDQNSTETQGFSSKTRAFFLKTQISGKST